MGMENPREEDKELHGGLHIIWSSIKHKELLVEGYQASHLNIRHPRYERTPRPFLDHGNGAHALPLSLRSSAAMAVGEGRANEMGGKGSSDRRMEVLTFVLDGFERSQSRRKARAGTGGNFGFPLASRRKSRFYRA
jgi:hypothetical protein